MSAGPVRMLAPAHPQMPSRATRPPLRLVASEGKLSPGVRIHAPGLPGTRFTRRGHLVITLVVAVAAVTLALMLAASVDAAAPQIDHATTVSAGQTLSEVAAAQLPSLPNHNAVAVIQLANGLNSSEVQAGQSLLIPAIP